MYNLLCLDQLCNVAPLYLQLMNALALIIIFIWQFRNLRNPRYLLKKKKIRLSLPANIIK